MTIIFLKENKFEAAGHNFSIKFPFIALFENLEKLFRLVVNLSVK